MQVSKPRARALLLANGPPSSSETFQRYEASVAFTSIAVQALFVWRIYSERLMLQQTMLAQRPTQPSLTPIEQAHHPEAWQIDSQNSARHILSLPHRPAPCRRYLCRVSQLWRHNKGSCGKASAIALVTAFPSAPGERKRLLWCANP